MLVQVLHDLLQKLDAGGEDPGDVRPVTLGASVQDRSCQPFQLSGQQASNGALSQQLGSLCAPEQQVSRPHPAQGAARQRAPFQLCQLSTHRLLRALASSLAGSAWAW